MSYIDGFVLAVPTANMQKFTAHATDFDCVFLQHGATRVVECRGADVPRGKITKFYGAVHTTDDGRWCSRGSHGPTKAAATT